MYGASPYRGAPTATFDAHSRAGKYNEDALPAMPSWDNAATRRVEDEESMEMGQLGEHHPHAAQSQQLLADHEAQLSYGGGGGGYSGQQAAQHPNERYYAPQDHSAAGDLGGTGAARYEQHHQYAPSAPMSPVSPTAYEPSVAPPSYQTRPPSMVSPVRGGYAGQIGRRPVQGSWRDV